MIPDHLQSTWDLLKRAYPSGIPTSDYLAVLAVLYPHMSDRNLAQVAATFTGKTLGIVTNDVYAVGAGGRVTPESVAEVRKRLDRVGLAEWLLEE